MHARFQKQLSRDELVAYKSITIIQRLLADVIDKDRPSHRQMAVYKIKCCDCQATYIGETGRDLNTGPT